MSHSTPHGLDPVPRKPLAFPRRHANGTPLPASLTSFVGREREMEALTSLLRCSTTRLVTVTGPGGVGKTRLSLQVAEEISADFADGVVFVDLTPVTAPNLVVSTVAQALGTREAGDQPIEDRLVDTLRDQHLLLVLDNFEPHVTAAPMVSRLLGCCPQLTALVTSREPLRLSGERVVTLSPLTLPDPTRPADDPIESEAVRLFVERATATRMDFALTDANTRCVVAIVQRVDGLPLAIELAAARLAHLPPAVLLERLEHRLPLLTGGARDLPRRHRTLRDTIAWSCDLMTITERRVFCRLAVFVGGCTLEAAEAMASVEVGSAAIDNLASLVAKSLVRQEEDHDGGSRFTMLETVREYGMEKLIESGEEEFARDRYGAFFLQMAERADPAIWGGPDHRWWLDQLEAELANFRAALDWFERSGDGAAFLRLAAALGGLWHYRSHRVEGREWLTRALATADDTVPRARAMAYIKLGILERYLGGEHAADLTSRGLALRKQLGDQREIGHALLALATCFVDREEYDNAVPVLEEAATVLEAVGATGGMAKTKTSMGMVLLEQGDPARAHALLTEALALHRGTGFAYGVASALLLLGQIEADRGGVTDAAARYAESLSLWLQVKSEEGLVDALAATACLAMTDGRPDSAALLLAAAESIGAVLGYVAPSQSRTRHTGAAAAARAALGDHGYATARESGRVLSRGDAVTEAKVVLTQMTERTTAAADGLVDSASSGLTPREQSVLRLLVEGYSDREIAQDLGISYRTVTSYVRNILDKFNVQSRTAAATQAVRRGLV